MSKYKCIILDHDDTVVDSTPAVHYPAFMAALSYLRPEVKYTLEEFVRLNYLHGFSGLMRNVLSFTEEEVNLQEQVCREYMEQCMPRFYPMMGDIVRQFKVGGGKICVASHSYDEYIIRDFVANCGVRPDKIFSCDMPERTQRKPYPYPVEWAIKEYGLDKQEILVVDDLPTGLNMANAAGVDFAYAGWGTYVSEIMDFMCKNAKFVLTEVYELAELLF